MTRFTAEPFDTLVPAAGLSLMTSPETTVLLDCIVTVPTVRPAAVIADSAAAWVSPVTVGTLIGGGVPDPLEAPPPQPDIDKTKQAVASQATRRCTRAPNLNIVICCG
jgi:hypothetical protein